ncbi:NAD(P)H-hydrate dehydratase [Candidatus Aerophobetes bacterium]|nr:NAD(P)H-hydrate dehydratase [Candidatus Aerophobetes bacterium]
MRELDSLAIEKIGIPGLVLMENAGEKVAELIEEKCSPLSGKLIYIFCGRGNNGGDGLVAARHLFNKRCRVRVFLATQKDKLKGDAATNLKIALNIGIDVREIVSESDVFSLKKELEKKRVIVDALLGTGAKGAPRGVIKELIKLINSLEGNVVAVDIPSGVDADTGEVPGEAVKAKWTVTFAYPKRGLYLYPGMDYTGKIKVVDIGIPYNLLDEGKIKSNLFIREDVPPNLFFRKPSSHKGSFGHLLVIAGSRGMTGAGALASLAALRVGAGLVTLGIPCSLNPILEMKLTEVMTLPLPETEEGTLSLKALDKICQFARRCKALVLGPGLSTQEETKELVKKIMVSLKIPLVLDADGITALAENTKLIAQYPAPLIITPHPGELSRLLSISIPEVQKDRIFSSKILAEKTGKIAILKGARTVITDEQGNSWVNSTGNPGMASGGSGDVLSGILGGFLVQGMGPLMAAKIGVYLHGLSADLVVKEKGQLSLIAGDILENIPQAIRSLKNGCC